MSWSSTRGTAATRRLSTPPRASSSSSGRRPRPTSTSRCPCSGDSLHKAVGAVNLAQSIRRYGHLAAQLDPLGLRKPLGDPSLLPGDPRPHRRRSALAARQPDLVAALRGRHVHVRGGRGAPPHLLLDDRLRLRARVRARGAALAAPRGGVRALPRAGRSDRSGRAARSADAGRGVRAVPAPHLPGQDALLDRRPRHARADPRRGHRRGGGGRHRQHPDRHGAPRPAERDGARAEQAVRADPRRVQGSGLVAELPRGHGVDRRRQVPRRRASRDQGRRGDGSRRLDAAQSEPPRSDRSGRRGHGARGGHDRSTGRGRRSSIRRAACRS